MVSGGGFSGPGTEVARFFAVLGLDARQFNAGIVSAQASATGLNRVLVGGAGLAGGFLVATAAIRGIDAVIMGSVRGVIDYETAFVGLQKTVIATDEEFDQIDQNIRDLATGTIPLARTELARIGQIGGQLGVRGVEDLNQFIDTIARLGVATDLTTENAGIAMARLSAIFQRPIQDVEALASAIVLLGNTEAAFEQEIIDIALRIGPSANIVGISEAFTLGLSATLPAIGLRPELAGTAIQRLLVQLDSMVQEGGDKLALLAAISRQTSEEFVDNWENDGEGAIISFLEGLDDLESVGFAALEGLSLGQQRTLRTLLALADNVPKLERNVASAAKELANATELNRESERVFGTTASQIAIFESNVRELADSIGGPLVEALNDVLPLLTEFVNMLAGGNELELADVTKAAEAADLSVDLLAGPRVLEQSGTDNMERNFEFLSGAGFALAMGKLAAIVGGVAAGPVAGLAVGAGLISDAPQMEDTIFDQTMDALAAAHSDALQAFADSDEAPTAGEEASLRVLEGFLSNAYEETGALFGAGIIQGVNDSLGNMRGLEFASPAAAEALMRSLGFDPTTGTQLAPSAFDVPFGPHGAPSAQTPEDQLLAEEEFFQLHGDGAIPDGADAEVSAFQQSILDLLAAMDEGTQAVSRLQQLAESTAMRRAKELVRAFASGDEAEVQRLSNVFDSVDEELARLAPMIMERFGLLPVEVADIFDDVRSEIESAKDDIGFEASDLVQFLVARRLGEGADPASLFTRKDGEPLIINNNMDITITGDAPVDAVLELVGGAAEDGTRAGLETVG